METLKLLGIMFLVVVGVITTQTYLSYQHDIRAARERVMTGSQVIETACGTIEYATMGEGPPVLVVHGAGGGYDQGLIISEIFLNDDFRVIAPSRFGFLRTPLAANASFAAQADAYVCLLDALNISKVAIIGISAGGPSSLEFALRHQDRVLALVLESAVVHKEKPMDFKFKIIHQVIFKSDFLFWIIAKNFESNLISFFGIPPEVQANLTSDEKHWLSNVFIPAIHPISQRQSGMLNDQTNFPFLDYQLGEITVPTLIIHATDDTLVNPSHSEYAARKIPNARVITLESGGHILMGQEEKVRSEVSRFLKQHLAQERR